MASIFKSLRCKLSHWEVNCNKIDSVDASQKETKSVTLENFNIKLSQIQTMSNMDVFFYHFDGQPTKVHMLPAKKNIIWQQKTKFNKSTKTEIFT